MHARRATLPVVVSGVNFCCFGANGLWAGAIVFRGGTSDLHVSDTVFIDNAAWDDGGACLFVSVTLCGVGDSLLAQALCL